MGKRSDLEKIDKDFYRTVDPDAVTPLIPYVRGKTFAETFYGDGDLEDLLMDAATCKWRSDIRKTVLSSRVMPATEVLEYDLRDCDLILSNPPFTRSVLLPCIEHLSKLRPTWLLLPADYMHNRYFGSYMSICDKVVSVGRVKWFKDSKSCSTDNFAWYHWWDDKPTVTRFYGR